MYEARYRPFSSATSLLVLVTALMWIQAVQGQCVDSSEVTDFKVRTVKFKTLFGAIPKDLRRLLDSHRNETYSSDRASQYLSEITNFYAADPAQEKYERLIANKLKLSVKAGKTWLDCVEKVEATECQQALGGSTQCVDVILKRYFVDIDALDSSPYFLLFPRSGLTTLYGAIPRPLLALNPSFDALQDETFGPAASIDTATDLLDLPSIFREPAKSATPSQGPLTLPPPEPTRTDGLEITFPSADRTDTSAIQDQEPLVNLDSKDTKLLLRLKGRKSLNHDFYDTTAGLTLARTKPLDLFQNVALEARFDSRKLPQGNGDLHTNAAFVGFSTDLRFKKGVLKLINVDGKYRWSRDQFFSNDGTLPNQISSEYGFESRTLVDGNFGGGLFRSAMWVDYGSINRNLGSYGRVAAVAGYGKEFVIRRKKHFHEISPPELSEPCWTSYPDPKKPEDSVKNEPSVGLELIVGGGHAWGDVPEYARFYGGSPPGQFLHDELSAQSLTSFPSGPQIRSLGQNEAGIVTEPGNVIRGGTSFWNASLNVSLPISGWSRPLIPHEWVTFSPKREGDEEFDGHAPAGANICRDLKATVKTLVGISGMNLMANQQARDLLTTAQKRDLLLRNKENPTAEEVARLRDAEEALARAKARVKPEVEALFKREILPVTDFIADYANIISVKPLLMFDVAHLGLSTGQDNRTRYAAGGGLQIDIVLARFEFGYIAALNRAPRDPRGSFVGRLVLRRLF